MAVPPSATAPPGPETPQNAPQPLPWRPILAGWPEEWRERWGRKANALEAEGLPWREAERRAFVAVLAERRAGVSLEPPAPAPSQQISDRPGWVVGHLVSKFR